MRLREICLLNTRSDTQTHAGVYQILSSLGLKVHAGAYQILSSLGSKVHTGVYQILSGFQVGSGSLIGTFLMDRRTPDSVQRVAGPPDLGVTEVKRERAHRSINLDKNGPHHACSLLAS
jgi:hypothetical protein